MEKAAFILTLVFLLHVGVISSWRADRGDGRPRRHLRDFFDSVFKPRRFGFSTRRDGARRDPWFNVDLSFGSKDKAWWEGPNVCLTRDVKPADDSSAISTHSMFQSVVCDGSDTAFRCTTSKSTPSGRVISTETYECCTGYTRKPTDHGCIREVQLVDLSVKLESLQLDSLVSLLRTTGLSEDLREEGLNFTVFAPTDQGLSTITELLDQQEGLQLQDMASVVMVSKEISDVLIKDTMNILLGHMVTGRVTTPHMQDEQLLETASPYKTTIRINTYRRPVNIVTANCQKITSSDNMASNGVVHVVEKPLLPVTDSLMELVGKNPELSALKTVLGRSPLAASLREDGQLTLLAPTDAAFKKHREVFKKLLNDPKCVDNFLKNHVLPNVICSSVIQGAAKTLNLLSKYINLTRDGDDKLYVEGVQIVTTDVMATNGVLHLIDDILIPDEALDLLELAERQGLTDFLGLVKQAGLLKELRSSENVTLFIPSNDAIQQLKGVAPESLPSLLRFHVIPEVHSCRSLYNNRQLYTSQKDARLRFNEYSMFPFRRSWTQTVQCAHVRPQATSGCNGVFYVVDKVLVPPVGNVLDVLSRDSRFSTLVQLLKVANLSDTLQTEGPFTVFAPTDEVFERLDRTVLMGLMNDTEALRDILLGHVAADFVCCAGIMQRHWYHTQRIRTLSGAKFQIFKEPAGTVVIDDNNVVTCDVTATNGVVHVIDGLLEKEADAKSMDWLKRY